MISYSIYYYDDCGNLMSKLEAYAMYPTLYYYDLRNRLGYVSKNTSMYDFIKYTLDSRGRRTALYQYYGAYPTKDINMSYSGGTSVYERDYVMNGMDLVRDVTQIFYRGSDYGGGVGGLLYASNLDGTDLNYKHYNLRGDVVQTTANDGTIKSNLYYTAFGSIISTGTTPTDSFRSNTKYVDSFGIINEGFRCRSTNSDRFLSPDPLEYIDGLNQYLYCSQNPWGRFDALGLSWYNDAYAAIKDHAYAAYHATNVSGSIGARAGVNVRLTKQVKAGLEFNAWSIAHSRNIASGTSKTLVTNGASIDVSLTKYLGFHINHEKHSGYITPGGSGDIGDFILTEGSESSYGASLLSKNFDKSFSSESNDFSKNKRAEQRESKIKEDASLDNDLEFSAGFIVNAKIGVNFDKYSQKLKERKEERQSMSTQMKDSVENHVEETQISSESE